MTNMKGKLGFGLMRLPKKGLGIDIKKTSEMVDMFLDRGYTYFDTAFVYPGSEAAAKKALVDRHPRDSYTLATKLMAGISLNEKSAKEEFFTSLKRTGAEYFDYYLLHSLQSDNYERYEKFHLWDFVNEQKAAGTIKHIGFSFHDKPDLLEKLLKEHPEVEFVQLQINYADWDSPAVCARENYELVRKYGKQLVIMEPVKGGKLANPPAEVKKIFDAVNPDVSYASWAIRFAASLDGLLACLSGMSTLQQVEDNTTFMSDFKPLSDEEMAAVRKAQKVFNDSPEIPCTACHYCTPGCPKQIPIPEIFSAENLRLTTGRIEEARAAYASAVGAGSGADSCITCHKCENICPQHIKVSDHMKTIAEAMK